MSIDAMLFTTSEITESVNLRYFTGFTGSDAALLITPSERHFITDGRYGSQAKEQTSGLHIHVERSKLDALVRLLRKFKVENLGVEAGRLSYQFAREIERRAKTVLTPLKPQFIANLRIRKTPEELAIISQAAAIASAACEELLSEGLIGKQEIVVARRLEELFIQGGADGVAFNTIVASGMRSALPHGVASEKPIQKGELVILDYGCTLKDYHSDETVTVKTATKPTKEEAHLVRAVQTAHDAALAAAVPGVKAADLDKVARESLRKEGYGQYFTHSLGHGLGLEVHEPPSLSPRGQGDLQEGMVFTIEPGIYIEGVGGARLESLVYMSADGPKVLSKMKKKLLTGIS